jgi:hypothetical protein
VHLLALMKAEMRGTEWEQKLDHWSGERWEQKEAEKGQQSGPLWGVVSDLDSGNQLVQF